MSPWRYDEATHLALSRERMRVELVESRHLCLFSTFSGSNPRLHCLCCLPRQLVKRVPIGSARFPTGGGPFSVGWRKPRRDIYPELRTAIFSFLNFFENPLIQFAHATTFLPSGVVVF